MRYTATCAYIDVEASMASNIRDTWPLSDTDLKPALELALAIEHAPMGVLMLQNETSGTLEPVIAEGLSEEQRARFVHQRPGIGPVGIAFQEQRRVSIQDVTIDGADGSLRE